MSKTYLTNKVLINRLSLWLGHKGIKMSLTT